MKLVKVTIPQSGQNSPVFDTENLNIVGLTYFNVDVLDGTPSLKFQTPAPGQDPLNPAATFIDVLEVAPGISTDADDAGAITPAQTRPYLEIPNLILELAGAGRNYFYCVPKGNRVPKFYGVAASTPGHDAAAAPTEGDFQQTANQLARVSNYFPPGGSIPRFLRIALGANQTTAAVDFYVALAEPTQSLIRNTSPRQVTVNFGNGNAFSDFFELFPGEKLVGIATPAAFTTADLNLETPKPGLDQAISTDANWLTVAEYVTEQTVLTGATPGDVFKWYGAAQGQYLAVPDINAIELPRYMRLKGSANQGAARVVTLFIQ
jgi:hypothetical protein